MACGDIKKRAHEFNRALPMNSIENKPLRFREPILGDCELPRANNYLELLQFIAYSIN